MSPGEGNSQVVVDYRNQLLFTRKVGGILVNEIPRDGHRAIDGTCKQHSLKFRRNVQTKQHWTDIGEGIHWPVLFCYCVWDGSAG